MSKINSKMLNCHIVKLLKSKYAQANKQFNNTTI